MVTNVLGFYNPEFYAQEALIQLEKALGMASRVFMGYDEERKTFGKGDVINIKKPSIFTAESAPSSAQNVETGSVQLDLDQWFEVKFELTDQELAYTGEKIIEDHIRPAAFALADNIDQALAALHEDIPWFVDLSGTPDVGDITDLRTIMFDNSVPMNDPGKLHYMIDGSLEGGFLGLSAFSQNQGAGDTGVSTQLTGSLGTKYGIEIFANQNTPDHTGGAMADGAGAVDGAHAKGVTSITIDTLTDTQTVKAGDSFVIAGNTQRYAFTENGTVAGSQLTAIGITPALVEAQSGSEVVTVRVDTNVSNIMFHRNAFALAMAPLSEAGSELGAKIATIQDPITGLSLRSRVFYDGGNSKVIVALDVLYGIKTLDPNLAVIGAGAA